MTVTPIYSLRCTGAELACLCAAVEGTHLVGLPDPFRDLAPDALRREVASAGDSLVKRGHCVRGPGGLRLDPRLEELVRTLAFAPGCVSIGQRTREGTAFLALYGRPPRLVEVAAGSSADEYRLSLQQQSATAWEHLSRFLAIPPGGPAERLVFSLPESFFRRSRESRSGEAASRDVPMGDDEALAVRELRRYGLPEERARELLGVLRAPVRTGTVCVLQRSSGGGWLFEGSTFFEGPAGFWRCRPLPREGERWTEVATVASSELRDGILNLARQVLGL